MLFPLIASKVYNPSSLNNEKGRIALLWVLRYPWWAVPFAFLSMAIFRLPLWLNRRVLFWRLMGSGRNGTFDIVPDFQQWSVLLVLPATELSAAQQCRHPQQLLRRYAGRFISGWVRLLCRQQQALLLQPREGHGLWNGQPAFGDVPRKGVDWQGPIAVLTRATIRLSRASAFWKHVDAVAQQMAGAPGFVASYGIGEIPFIKQATFSLWQSKEHMMAFAYQLPMHKEVVRKTHAEKWYSEDMFMRFAVLQVWNLPALESYVQSGDWLAA